MKKKFFMPLIAAMTLFASCQDDEIVNDQMEIKAVISEAIDSRTAIDDYNDYGSSVGVLWLPNENIGVYSSYNKNVKFTSTNKSSTGEATFRGLMLGTPKYAYYQITTYKFILSLTSLYNKKKDTISVSFL